MRRIAATLAVVGALLFSAGSAWADFDDGDWAYNMGDYDTALREWRPLAEQGDADAQYNLGLMYADGVGVPENDAEAVKWYSKAAEQGHAQGQTNLAAMYALGKGVPVNDVKAYMWWSSAKALGNEMAARNLEKLSVRMTPAQIAEAQTLATFLRALAVPLK